jgi:hypothetical protein
VIRSDWLQCNKESIHNSGEKNLFSRTICTGLSSRGCDKSGSLVVRKSLGTERVVIVGRPGVLPAEAWRIGTCVVEGIDWFLSLRRSDSVIRVTNVALFPVLYPTVQSRQRQRSEQVSAQRQATLFQFLFDVSNRLIVPGFRKQYRRGEVPARQ